MRSDVEYAINDEGIEDLRHHPLTLFSRPGAAADLDHGVDEAYDDS